MTEKDQLDALAAHLEAKAKEFKLRSDTELGSRGSGFHALSLAYSDAVKLAREWTTHKSNPHAHCQTCGRPYKE